MLGLDDNEPDNGTANYYEGCYGDVFDHLPLARCLAKRAFDLRMPLPVEMFSDGIDAYRCRKLRSY